MHASRFVALALATSLCGVGCGGGDSDAPMAAQVVTIAGGSLGDGRLATEVPLDASDVATDRDGNIYLNDHARVRRIDAATGRISTIAGGDDPAQCEYSANGRRGCFHATAIAADRNGRLYATHSYEGAIVEIDPRTGSIRFVAQVGLPAAIATDRAGNVVVHDVDAAQILRIDVRTGAITTVAGNGDRESRAADCPVDVPATTTCLGQSVELATDSDGGVLISADAASFLRRVDPDSGVVTALPVPNGRVAVAADGTLVVSLPAEDRVVRADPATGALTTLVAGTPKAALSPAGVAVDAAGRVLVLSDDRLLRLDRVGGAPDVVAGNGSADECADGGRATEACLGRISDLDVAPNGDVVLAQWSGPIRVVDGDGRIATVTDLRDAPAACAMPRRLAVGPTGDAFVADLLSACRIERDGGTVSLVAGGASCDAFGKPRPRDGDLAVGACLVFTDLLVDAEGGLLIADDDQRRVWRVEPATGRLALVAGTGERGPCGTIGDGGDARAACVATARLAQDGGANLYVLEDGDFGYGTRVRRIDAATGIITTIAGTGYPDDCGDGGPAATACIAANNMLVDPDGNVFLGGRSGVRKIDATTGIITTVYRDDTSRFDVSLDALDGMGRFLFFTADSAPRVRRLTLPAAVRRE